MNLTNIVFNSLRQPQAFRILTLSCSTVLRTTGMEWYQCRVRVLYYDNVLTHINQPDYILNDPKLSVVSFCMTTSHFVWRPLTFCMTTPYILYDDPLHFVWQPLTFCMTTPYILYDNPLHFVWWPILSRWTQKLHYLMVQSLQVTFFVVIQNERRSSYKVKGFGDLGTFFVTPTTCGSN